MTKSKNYQTPRVDPDLTAKINPTIECLNQAFLRDPAAIHALICNRVPCNRDLADDPHVIVDNKPPLKGRPDNWTVSVLGLINGILKANGLPEVAAYWSEAKESEMSREFLGFGPYSPPNPWHAKSDSTWASEYVVTVEGQLVAAITTVCENTPGVWQHIPARDPSHYAREFLKKCVEDYVQRSSSHVPVQVLQSIWQLQEMEDLSVKIRYVPFGHIESLAIGDKVRVLSKERIHCGMIGEICRIDVDDSRPYIVDFDTGNGAAAYDSSEIETLKEESNEKT